MSLPVTEDTPPDMLAGFMDLNVVLPNGRTVKISVHRSTPMMDLLVQVTTAHCLSPGDYSLQAMGDKCVLPFKPNTPIGALDTFTVKIVEKKSIGRGRAPQVPQSFLNTFRLQVHLPRSQLFVLRVTPDVALSEIMTHICTEKNLNLEKYEFRNPGNSEEILQLDKTLGYYKLQELSLVSKSNRTVSGLMSTADMINVKSTKHRQNSVCDSSLSSGSFGSRSGSPVPAINVVTAPPQPPIRKKRRPAPKPPKFADKEKKDQTSGSVLISHSRESSDSSGYHEASLLSESPTHGGPVGGMDDSSPSDTLSRRRRLPPSQSFTNLTSIQPTSKTRLRTSVSNTSLNSNGYSRKKRAPPPPQIQRAKEDKMKSSTLPSYITEGMRNGSGFLTEDHFRCARVDAPQQATDTKVQSPSEIESHVVNEAKATSNDVPSSVDVNIRLPPKPKPRTVLLQQESSFEKPAKVHCLNGIVSEESHDSSGPPNCSSLNGRSHLENVIEESDNTDDDDDPPGNELLESVEPPRTRNEYLVNTSQSHFEVSDSVGAVTKTVHSVLFVGSSGEYDEVSGNQDQGDHDSISWEYQLPPPPTDFRDSSSPNCTEFGTIAIRPKVFENVSASDAEQKEKGAKNFEEGVKSHVNGAFQVRIDEIENDISHHNRSGLNSKKLSQTKVEVMSELTNILNGSRKQKEKSLSVSDLYLKDSISDTKKSCLGYSKSFSTEPATSLDDLKVNSLDAKELTNNKKLSSSNEFIRPLIADNEITYRNFKNLEKSYSMESIQSNKANENNRYLIEKTEDVFRKPVPPVQKKLQIARRSASSVGVRGSSPAKRNVAEDGRNSDSWSDDPNICVLRQQFLEFLKEKKLMNNELKMKSLDVIRNILPELESLNNSSAKTRSIVDQTNEANSQRNAQYESEKVQSKESKVKVVDVKVKSPPVPDTSSDEVTLRNVNKPKEEVIKRESMMADSGKEKNTELTKRFSYQGPPGPPSINFGTWGERPKTTRIIIKDEDYVTREKLTEKKSEMVQNMVCRNGDIFKRPKEVKKTQIIIKKPGVLSHYEMFSALPKRKEITSFKFVQAEQKEKEEEENNKNLMDSGDSKESNRVPVVCGMELKKEFKHATPVRSLSFCSRKPEVAESDNSKFRHSVYVNGNQDSAESETFSNPKPFNFIIPKRNPTLMPVVKGFRAFEENSLGQVNLAGGNRIDNQLENSKKENNGNNERPSENSKWSSPKKSNGILPPPPPLPNINSIKLKPVLSVPVKPKTVTQDPRTQLLDEIRNFGGLRKLKKSALY